MRSLKLFFFHEQDQEETAQYSGDEMETEAPRFVAHVSVPSQKEIEEAILRRKKQELLDKYVSQDLLQDVEQTKTFVSFKP